jgi:hypothetical protein
MTKQHEPPAWSGGLDVDDLQSVSLDQYALQMTIAFFQHPLQMLLIFLSTFES